MQQASDKIAEMEDIASLAARGIRGKLKKELLREGSLPLEQSLAKFDQMMQVEDKIAKLRSKVFAAADRLNGFALDFAYFQAEEEWAKLANTCDSIENRLSGLRGDYAG